MSHTLVQKSACIVVLSIMAALTLLVGMVAPASAASTKATKGAMVTANSVGKPTCSALLSLPSGTRILWSCSVTTLDSIGKPMDWVTFYTEPAQMTRGQIENEAYEDANASLR